MKRTLSILGSTGSIGQSTLRVLDELDEDYRLYGLSCRRNIPVLRDQIERYAPQAVAIEDEDAFNTDEVRALIKNNPGIEFLCGIEGVCELAGRPVDVLVSAIVGSAGLRPSLTAVNGARRIALANKETMVMAGDFYMSLVREKGIELIPVDSEHSAIFSLIHDIPSDEIYKVVLTASGGSLRDLPLEKLKSVDPDQALAHPTWSMGKKITIDSATLMNKGLEVIEAHHLFNIPYDKIDVIIHPESAVHSMVETVDGAIYAHMGVADMAHPIHNALTYPRRRVNSFGRLDLISAGTLTFNSPDPERYPALKLSYEAGKRGGTAPAILNAANEIAVHSFLKGSIAFTQIVEVVDKTLSMMKIIENPALEDIFMADEEARKKSSIFLKEL